MNLREDLRRISYIKTNAADMLKRVNDTHNPIKITQIFYNIIFVIIDKTFERSLKFEPKFQ
jgi:PHD/YefM family antitoxin component YafN of YafNO toxin-antitoxin module